jgi:hypothetical protein
VQRKHPKKPTRRNVLSNGGIGICLVCAVEASGIRGFTNGMARPYGAEAL